MSREQENIEKLMSEKSVEFRDFELNNICTRKKDDGTEEMILEGTPCVFNEETVMYKNQYYECREIIDPDAFNECDMSDVIFNYNHAGRVYARTRNNSLQVSTDKHGLNMQATLMQNDEGHAQLYRDVKSGLIDKMSFAFHVQESEYSYVEQSDGPTVETRRITKIDKLYDVSAVDIPAYDATTISARNAFDTEREKRHAVSVKRAKERLRLKLMLGGF